jgi:hypothetical protein
MCVRVCVRSNCFKQGFAKAPKAPHFDKITKVWQTHQREAKASHFGKATTKLLGKVPDYHWLVKIKKINLMVNFLTSLTRLCRRHEMVSEIVL